MGKIIMNIRDILKQNKEESSEEWNKVVTAKSNKMPTYDVENFPALETCQPTEEQYDTVSQAPNFLNSTVNISTVKSSIRHSTPAPTIKRKSSATPPGGRARKQPVLQDYFLTESETKPQPSYEPDKTDLSNDEQTSLTD